MLIQEIEKLKGFDEGVLSKAKAVNWNPLNSFTHCGFLQVVRRNKTGTIEPNYKNEEIIDALGYVNSVGMLTAMQIAHLAGSNNFAEELLEKSKEVLRKY